MELEQADRQGLPGNMSHSRKSALMANAGFTLLEVILAMSLSIVLLAALYAALKLHLTFAQRGPEQVRKVQLARAVVERIARDVRAVVPQAAKESSTSASSTSSSNTTTGATPTGSTGSTSSSSTSTTSGSTSEPDPYRDAFGVLGGTDWLQLYVADYHPNLDDTELAAAGGSVAQALNVVRVTYTLSYISTSRDAQGRTQRMALARSEVAAIGAQRLDSASDDSDYRATTEFLCDDIGQVQFQYWDDTTQTWLDYWGSDTPIAPPRAIKVFVSLLAPDEYLKSQLGLSGGLSTWQPNFQLVIPIATWTSDSSAE